MEDAASATSVSKNGQNRYENGEGKQTATSDTNEEQNGKLDNKISGQEMKSSSSSHEFTPKLATNTRTSSDDDSSMINKRKLYHR